MAGKKKKRKADVPPQIQDRLDSAVRGITEGLRGRDAGEISAAAPEVYHAAAAGLAGFEDRLIEALSREKTSDVLVFLYRLLPELQDKPVQKAARKAIYKLEQAGLSAPDEIKPRVAGIIRGPEKPAPSAWLGVLDPEGMRMGVLAVPGATGGYETAVFLGGAAEGLADFQAWRVTAGDLGRVVADLSSHGPPPGLIASAPEHARFCLAEAAERSRYLGAPLPDDYHSFLPSATGISLPGHPGIYDHISGETAYEEVDLAESVDALFEHDLMAGFALGPELGPYVERLQAVEQGVLVVSEVQREQQRREVLADAAREIFSPEALGYLRRRLEETAYLFWMMDLPDHAATALAAAVDLERRNGEGTDYPAVAAMMRKSRALLTGLGDRPGQAPRPEGEEPAVTESGLILPPGYESS